MAMHGIDDSPSPRIPVVTTCISIIMTINIMPTIMIIIFNDSNHISGDDDGDD